MQSPLHRFARPAVRRNRRQRRIRINASTVLRFEHLEPRQLLSNTPPTVEELLISGQAWRDVFVSKLASTGDGNGGYRLTAQNQSAPLPWSNLNRLSIRFNENVDVRSEDLF